VAGDPRSSPSPFPPERTVLTRPANSGPAAAPHRRKAKCNAGNGNGSDAITFVLGAHCYGGDPGKSYNAGNRGGDEIPTSGGVANPGGNNVP
jgi:hypothetical protein